MYCFAVAVDQYKNTKKTRQIIAGDVTLWRGGGRQSAGRVTHFHSIYLLLDTYGLGFARKIYLGGWPLSIVAVWESGGCQQISQSHLLTDDGRTLGRGLRALYFRLRALYFSLRALSFFIIINV